MATRYRDLQRPALLETGLVDTGAVRMQAQLAQSFRDFENTALEIGGALREQEGAVAGAAEGAAGTPRPRTGFGATTRFGQAYNNAAEVTYANKVQLDLAQDLERIELESDADPIGYANKAQALYEGTLREAPAVWKPRVQQIVAPLMAAGTARVNRQALVKGRQEAQASYMATMPTLVDTFLKNVRELSPEQGDEEMARLVSEHDAKLAALVADGVYTAPEAEKLRQVFVADLDQRLSDSRTGDVVADIAEAARMDASTADSMLADIEAREDLSLEEKTQIRSDVRGQMELLQYERSRQHVDELSALSKRLAAGDFGAGVESEARRLYRRAAMSPEEYEGVLTAAERNRQVRIERDTDKEAVVDLFSSEGGLDPANTEHQKAAETAFSEAAKVSGMATGDDRWRQTALQFVQRFNILPKSAESWARVALLSGDPLAATRAARFMSQVREAKPNAYAWNHEPKLEAFAAVLRGNMDAQIDPVQAYEMARKTTIDMKESEAAIREENYRKLVKKDPNIASLTEVVNKKRSERWGWQRDLPVPVAAQAEYESLVKQYYLYTDSLEEARNLAGEKIAGAWGESTVNGEPEIVKYPPEHKGITPEVVREDIAKTVAPLGLDPASLRLAPYAGTDRTRGVYWTLEHTDELGANETLLGADNRPLEYMLPVGQEFTAIRDAIKARKLAEAIEERAQRERNAQEQIELQRRIATFRPTQGTR